MSETTPYRYSVVRQKIDRIELVETGLMRFDH